MGKWTKWILVLTMGIMLSSATPLVFAEEATRTDEVTTEVVDPAEKIDPEASVDPAETIDPEASVDPADTIDPEASVDPEVSVEPRIMESTAVEAVQDSEAVEKTLSLAEKPSNDVAKTSTKEAVILFGVIGGLVVWLVGYRIYVEKKEK